MRSILVPCFCSLTTMLLPVWLTCIPCQSLSAQSAFEVPGKSAPGNSGGRRPSFSPGSSFPGAGGFRPGGGFPNNSNRPSKRWVDRSPVAPDRPGYGYRPDHPHWHDGHDRYPGYRYPGYRYPGSYYPPYYLWGTNVYGGTNLNWGINNYWGVPNYGSVYPSWGTANYGVGGFGPTTVWPQANLPNPNRVDPNWPDNNWIAPLAPQPNDPVGVFPNRDDDLQPPFPPRDLDPAVQPLDDAIGSAADVAEIRRRAAVLRDSTPATRAAADRMMASADESFAEQNYARAIARYRDAIAKAPDYAEPHFRLAHAYVAARRYNLALDSLMIALELSQTAQRDRFSLEDLYRGNKFAREQDDAQLLDAAKREPQDGGLQFLIGFTEYYDGQPDQAREHFRRASELPGPQQSYTRYFLPVVAIAEPD